jgi:dephospho-CoA kinase
MVVGITGNYCSGKDVACKLFERAGYRVIDVDGVGHEALRVKEEEIVRRFGERVLSGGRIDRKKLGDVVFGHDERRRDLEKIVHPWMTRQVRNRVRGEGRWVINAALLVEMCLWVICDHVIGVSADEQLLIERAVSRDGLQREEAMKRICSQIPTKEKLQYVDTVIDNNGDIDAFRETVKSVIDKLG